MPSKDNRPQPGAELRRRAEAIALGKSAPSSENHEALSPEETRQTLHELLVHQIELEMQNEELRRAQVELDAARARYFDLYDLAPVGYCTISKEGVILEANLTAATLLGATRSALVKQRVTRFILKMDQDLYYLHRNRLLETGEPQAFDLRMVKMDETAFWARLAATATPGAEGTPVCRVVLSDISARKQNEELEERVRSRTAALEAANRELEAFAHSVSHDLRSPLRGIDGWSLALLEDCGECLDAQGHQYIDRVRSEAQRMERLIDDLLHLSRVSRAELVPMTVDLSALAGTIAARLKEAHPGRIIEFIVAPQLKGTGDPRLLEIALTNLLEYAVKFTGPRNPARVEFGETEYAGKPAFFVRDNGVGFDVAYAGMLFGPFQRLHKTSEFPGTGIGLATVQRVIHRHGGRFWAEAQEGAGATLYFTLGENQP